MRYHIVKTYVRQYERDLFALTPVDMSNKMLQPFLLTISKFFLYSDPLFSRIEGSQQSSVRSRILPSCC